MTHSYWNKVGMWRLVHTIQCTLFACQQSQFFKAFRFKLCKAGGENPVVKPGGILSIRKLYVRKQQNLIGCNCRVRLDYSKRWGHLSCATSESQYSPGSCRAQPSNEKRTDWGSGNWILPVMSPGHVWRWGCALFRSSRQTVSVLYLLAANTELVRTNLSWPSWAHLLAEQKFALCNCMQQLCHYIMD